MFLYHIQISFARILHFFRLRLACNSVVFRDGFVFFAIAEIFLQLKTQCQTSFSFYKKVFLIQQLFF
jgi:hypothetical protein